MKILPAALQALTAYPHFLLCKFVPSHARPGKTEKFPMSLTTNQLLKGWQYPKNLTTPEIVLEKLDKLNDDSFGIGFVFTPQDPHWVLDIDNCFDVDKKEWSALSKELCQAFKGCAIEVSHSGKGLHIYGTGSASTHACKNEKLGIEFYTEGRFVAVTGDKAIGDASFDATEILKEIIPKYFPVSSNPKISKDTLTQAPVPEWNGPLDDDKLIERMLNSRSGANDFGSRASFKELWTNDTTALMKYFPDPDREYNCSRADAALAQHLAFWTGKHGERMHTLMMKSELEREKWGREDYLTLTINNACAKQIKVLSDPKLKIVNNPTNTSVESTFVTPEEQIKLFEGCVYILDENKILVPKGFMLTPLQFKAYFGGRSFPLDNKTRDDKNAIVTTNAFRAFTESQVVRFPRADSSTFLPQEKPATIIERPGQTLANLYWPINPERVSGDASPMLYHLEKMFPDERDRTIFLSYAAAIVRYPGIKFQYCLVIQGVQGNGKTELSRLIAYAVGERYSYFIRPNGLDHKFNTYQYKNIFISVEEARVPYDHIDLADSMKTMISATRVPIEPKGVDQCMKDVCCNYILNTNHKDSIRQNENDRIFAILYTAQQERKDIEGHGMGGDYFPNLREWMYHKKGQAIFANYLDNYNIPDEFNPATKCLRAPTTSSTALAIADGLGLVEQEILEAVDQGQMGFKGGWISSMAVDRLLNNLKLGHRISISRRKNILKQIGYSWHPGLKEGRATGISLSDGGKPRLYLKDDHDARVLEGGAVILRAYCEAQQQT